jgi:hypothetical protein
MMMTMRRRSRQTNKVQQLKGTAMNMEMRSLKRKLIRRIKE